MELPHGGEGWQQLRQGYLPPEFTAGKQGAEGEWAATGRTGLCGSKCPPWGTAGLGPFKSDMALPHAQTCPLSYVLSSS